MGLTRWIVSVGGVLAGVIFMLAKIDKLMNPINFALECYVRVISIIGFKNQKAEPLKD